MSLIPQIPNPYLATVALGLLYGTTFCTSACLPYVASYIASIGAGFRKGLAVTVIFNSGRMTAYAIIGAVTGVFHLFLSDAFLLSYQKYMALVFGVVTVAIGINLLLKTKEASYDCSPSNSQNLVSDESSQRFDFRAFTLGLTRGLVVCPPLVAILLYSITAYDPIDSFFLAVLFGLGTALSPLLILGGVTGWLLKKAPLFAKWIARIGAGILILLGLSMLFTAAAT
ncbi:sulfite exporter TauE/SafE family protein [Candidatus Bathyarchaeota archaeon]|nr:sulfite exporter TauE/SafE family protein [Candidatus Bathyarchaeota archaeon]